MRSMTTGGWCCPTKPYPQRLFLCSLRWASKRAVTEGRNGSISHLHDAFCQLLQQPAQRRVCKAMLQHATGSATTEGAYRTSALRGIASAMAAMSFSN